MSVYVSVFSKGIKKKMMMIKVGKGPKRQKKNNKTHDEGRKKKKIIKRAV